MTTVTVQLVPAQDPDEARAGYGDPGDVPPGTSHVSPVRSRAACGCVSGGCSRRGWRRRRRGSAPAVHWCANIDSNTATGNLIRVGQQGRYKQGSATCNEGAGGVPGAR